MTQPAPTSGRPAKSGAYHPPGDPALQLALPRPKHCLLKLQLLERRDARGLGAAPGAEQLVADTGEREGFEGLQARVEQPYVFVLVDGASFGPRHTGSVAKWRSMLESSSSGCYVGQMRTVEVEQTGPVAELLQRLRAGEEVVLTDRDVPVARLIRVAAPSGVRRFGIAKGRLHVHVDFDAPLENVGPYER